MDQKEVAQLPHSQQAAENPIISRGAKHHRSAVPDEAISANCPTGGKYKDAPDELLKHLVPGGQSACPEALRRAQTLGNLILPAVFSGPISGADNSLESSVGAQVQPAALWPKEKKQFLKVKFPILF